MPANMITVDSGSFLKMGKQYIVSGRSPKWIQVANDKGENKGEFLVLD